MGSYLGFGTGKNGSIGTGEASLVMASCTGTSGTKTLTVSNKVGTFANGDVVFIMQVKATSSPGLLEIAVINSDNSSTLTLYENLTNSYTSGAQVVRFLEYTGGIVTSNFYAPAWDGNVGGLLPLLINGVLTLNGGSVHANGKGLLGGGVSMQAGEGVQGRSGNGGTSSSRNGVAPGGGGAALENNQGGTSSGGYYSGGAGGGQGISSQGDEGAGGGGGGGHVFGGGGGGGGTDSNGPGGSGGLSNNVGGGKGGDDTQNGFNSSGTNGFTGAGGRGNVNRGAGGGGGGANITDIQNTLTKVFFGGGGGAGGSFSSAAGGLGGQGGGGLIIFAREIVITSGFLSANGNNGATGGTGRAGGGGGGAGGFVWVRTTNGQFGTDLIRTSGGNGGAATVGGYGGQGSKGIIYTETCSVTGSSSSTYGNYTNSNGGKSWCGINGGMI